LLYFNLMKFLLLSAVFVISASLCAPFTLPAQAHGVFQTQAEQDEALKYSKVDEKLGAALPKGLVFTDETGKPFKLDDYLRDKPVLLTLNYYECPMLCPIILGNLAGTMDKMSGLTPGKDFKLLTVSINSEGSLKNASDRADETYKMVARFGDPRPWWPFLLGSEPTIRALTDAVGFPYKKLGKDNFAHPSVLVVLSPGGKVSRYLYGIDYAPRDLRLALTEASKGKIGASAALNRLFLFCYHYDPVGKKYQLLALNVAKLIGGFVLVSLGILFVGLWLAEHRRKTDD
jgi:protein SCO1/2